MSSGALFYSNGRWHKKKNCYFQKMTGACLKKAGSEELTEALQKRSQNEDTLQLLKTSQDVCHQKRNKTLWPGDIFGYI